MRPFSPTLMLGVVTQFARTINPLLSPPSPFEGGGGLFEREGLFNLETTMVSVLHKELEYKVETLKYEKF